MDIFKFTAVGIIGALLCILVKEYRPALGTCVAISVVAFMFFGLFGQIDYIFSVVKMIGKKLSFSADYIEILVKITGISYVSRLGCEICRDSGQAAVCSVLEIVGKILIVTVSIPVLLDVMNLLIGLI